MGAAERGEAVLQAFVVDEKEALVVTVINVRHHYGSAQADSKLIAMKRWNEGLEVIAGVQIIVAQVFIE